MVTLLLHQRYAFAGISSGIVTSERLPCNVQCTMYIVQYTYIPRTSIFQKDARIVHRAVIKLTYPWLGEFRLGTITAGLVPGQDRNTLRTLVVLGGPESRFHSSSRIVNSIVTPLVRYFKVSKSCAEDLYKHWSEEIYVSTKITQHLIQGN